jgi:hypothetical protein
MNNAFVTSMQQAVSVDFVISTREQASRAGVVGYL